MNTTDDDRYAVEGRVIRPRGGFIADDGLSLRAERDRLAAAKFRAEAERDRLCEAIREHLDEVVPRDGSTVDGTTVALSAERLHAALPAKSKEME